MSPVTLQWFLTLQSLLLLDVSDLGYVSAADFPLQYFFACRLDIILYVTSCEGIHGLPDVAGSGPGTADGVYSVCSQVIFVRLGGRRATGS